MFRAGPLLVFVMLAAGCTRTANDPAPSLDPAPTRAAEASVFESGSAVVKPNAAYLEEARFAAADLERGELLSLSCRVCHAFEAGADPLIGPNLSALFGRPVASAPSFEYSAAMRGADFLWTPATLDAWLADPGGFLPGNAMPFAGFSSPSDRSDLLAYLLSVTGEGAP